MSAVENPSAKPDSPVSAPGPGNAPPPPDPLLARQAPTYSKKALWHWMTSAYDNFSAIDGSLWAASFAYYAFFSLFPMLLLIVTVGTDIMVRVKGPAAQHDAFTYTIKMVEPYLAVGPKDRAMIADTIDSAIKNRGSIGLIALASLIWSSLGFFQALVGATNKAWGEKPLNWWKLPLKSLSMLGVLGGTLLLGVLASTLVGFVRRSLSPDPNSPDALSMVLEHMVGPVILFCGFMLFYKLAPRRRSQVTFSMVWIPALLVTGLLQLCKQLFVFYSTNITNFNAIYGTFGGVIALMLWTYLSGMVIIFGGCLCAALRKTPRSTEGTAETVSESGAAAS